MRPLAPAIVLVLLGCAHGEAGPATRQSLDGARFPLPASDGRLETRGAVGETSAAIVFATEQPISRVSAGCFPGRPVTPGTVRLTGLNGAAEALPELTLPSVRAGGVQLGPIRAAFEPGQGPCEIALGLDVLRGLVLERSGIALLLHRAAPPAPAGEVSTVVELSRDPGTDRLLVPVQLRSGLSSVTLPFVLGTGEAHTRVDPAVASGFGAGPSGLPIDALALAPDVERCGLTVAVEQSWRSRAAAGVLGADGWGASHLIVDIPGARLVALRPRDAEPVRCPAHETEMTHERTAPEPAEPRDPR